MSLLVLFDGDSAPGPTPELVILDVDLLTRRLIRVELQDEVVVNKGYFDTDNYSVSVVEGSGPVEVTRILPFQDDTKVTRFIIIETQPVNYGSVYAVTITDATDRAGNQITVSDKLVDARYTKGDSILRSIPKHYDKRSASNIAGVLLALGRSDDLIGGSRDDDYTF